MGLASTIEALGGSFAADHGGFVDVLQPVLRSQSHQDLYLWLQGDLQNFLPHDIFLAVWGDESLENLKVDLISAIPGMRTNLVLDRDVMPLLRELVTYSRQIGYHPFCLSRPAGFQLPRHDAHCPVDCAFGQMKSALAHGIKDQRDHCDCLFVAFSHDPSPSPAAAKYLRMLIPYIDFALRQLEPVEATPQATPAEIKPVQAPYGLTQREVEIMKWVGAGKTNEVIGVILSISPFTVKNHLKRIFQKLEVTNRAQAVSKL